MSVAVLALTRCGLPPTRQAELYEQAASLDVLTFCGSKFTLKGMLPIMMVYILHNKSEIVLLLVYFLNNYLLLEPQHKESEMAERSQGKEISHRLRGMVEKRFTRRGRFRELEEISSISGSRWKNFFYGRQEATLEMVDFWCKKYPDERDWLLDGPLQKKVESATFNVRPMLQERPNRTIAERLTWVIFEWAAPSGEELFRYLEEKSNGTVPADDWKQVIIHAKPPSAAMVAVVGDYRPHFIEWIIMGVTTGDGQVDPTDKESIDKWNTRLQEQWNRVFNMLMTARQQQDECDK
ncbi:hypothetical protein HNQ59_001078 [Chitinivorax tropicus]|uniref:Uncharacterized protein n=1 Tax=Chitinivorax tropicus TaxID=714531 RepID=A0A840MGN3_9PROT|nr:hypothetical protein [Chitinivorax tropicus]MBB5017808.1 hypothetical protein [Chitinivorax tropicus]